MALVEYQNHVLSVNIVRLIFLYKDVQLLNRGNDDFIFLVVAGLVFVLQLPLKNSGGAVPVGGPFFKTVVFLHRLVVEVFPVDHEDHLVDRGDFRSEDRRLKRRERLAASCG